MNMDKLFVEMLGWKEGIIMLKEREYYSSSKELEETSIHFEMDYNIIIKNPRDGIPDVELEPTLQICIESETGGTVDKKELKGKLGEVVANLGIDPGDMLTIGYFGRYFDKIKNAK